jgi:predicted DNA-binding transcriptional regulator AlpA
MDKNKNQSCQLLTAKTLGQRLSLSKRQIFRLNSCGKIPAPVRIGGAVRWDSQECAEWLKAGAPDHKTWEAMKSAGQDYRKE